MKNRAPGEVMLKEAVTAFAQTTASLQTKRKILDAKVVRLFVSFVLLYGQHIWSTEAPMGVTGQRVDVMPRPF